MEFPVRNDIAGTLGRMQTQMPAISCRLTDAGLLDFEARGHDEDVELVLLAVEDHALLADAVDALAPRVDQRDVRLVEHGQEAVCIYKDGSLSSAGEPNRQLECLACRSPWKVGRLQPIM